MPRSFQLKRGYIQASAELIRATHTSLISASMFDEEMLKMAKIAYIDNIENKLRELLDVGLSEDDILIFDHRMKEMTQKLARPHGTSTGHSFEKVKTHIAFMTVAKMVVTVNVGNDEWKIRKRAFFVTLMLNSGQATPLPWEQLCFDVGGMDGIPSHVRVPEGLADEFLHGREAIRDMMPDGIVLLKDMQSELERVTKHCLDMDPYLALELAFLQDHAETMIRDRCHVAVLDALPSVTEWKSYKTVLAIIMDIRKSMAVISFGVTMEIELEAVYDIIAELEQGRGPKKVEVEKFSPFFKSVAATLMNFFKREDNVAPLGLLGKHVGRLIGIQALRSLMADLSRKMASNVVFGLEIVKPLKAFQFTLIAPEEKKMKEIIAYAMTHQKAPAENAITDGDGPVGVLVATSSASSSSSSSIVPAKPVARNAGKAVKAALKQDVKSKSMLRFFPVKPSHD